MEHEDFRTYIENTVLPVLNGASITNATIKSGLGDKAIIKRDKHGFYSIKYEYVRDRVGVE